MYSQTYRTASTDIDNYSLDQLIAKALYKYAPVADTWKQVWTCLVSATFAAFTPVLEVGRQVTLAGGRGRGSGAVSCVDKFSVGVFE